ncbi:hypothetical protein V1512DRAFT_221028 [Lipomyces arxii]|uniref:uncharacterized protein n=1 Tax=Lipomyces arxii TaxID=56418 RepID=UPI0034CFCE0E
MPEPTRVSRGFHIGHQKVELDVDLANKTITGSTEITILPSDLTIKTIRLDFRQGQVLSASINGKVATWDFVDYWATTSTSEFKESARTVHQYDGYQDKLSPVMAESLVGELVVNFPRGVKIQPQDSYGVISNSRISPSFARNDSPDINTASTRPEIYNEFVPLTVKVDFKLDNPAIGINFVAKSSENRYTHAYTLSNPIGLSTSNWLPCVDGLWERCSWEFSITVPKTVGDLQPADGTGVDGVNQEKDDEDSERDIVVVCIGDIQHEVTHTTNSWKKTVSFLMSSMVSAQHVGFAIGPFIQTNLSELEESEEDDLHRSQSAVEVLAYSLPGRTEDTVNTCMFMNKAMEFFVHEYSSYPFDSFSLCFVGNGLDCMEPYCGLAVVNDRFLFPQDVIDPIFTTTKYLTSLLAAQWSGVSIVPKYWDSLWVTVGICHYISSMFLRKLMGNNEYRYQLRKDAEKICSLDINRDPIGKPNLDFPLDKSTLEFICLKSAVVLHILDRRMTKSGGSFGLTRVIPKIFYQSMSGDLANGSLSANHFQKQCEKVSHVKLDVFFQEWILGSGYPIFRITQRFNKKKMFVEMGIWQVQNTEMPKIGSMQEKEFVTNAKRYLNDDETATSNIRPIFTGPMTIRIHEADGTPYEHVVNIKDSFTKLDIQYNTKYKRLKRHQKRNKNAGGAAPVVSSAAEPMDDGDMDEVLLHSLGDVLSNEYDMEEWRLTDWSKDDEDQMTNEAFEWLRVDSDFEWICVIYINQPDYMYASQLQQDRDVVAQYECIKYFSAAKPSPMYSTILVRTLMDRRYYHGIRVEAASALAKYALPELNWIGRYHLLKAFQTLFCFPDSLIPQGNDFSDFPTYFLQKAIPLALSEVIGENGQTPLSVKEFLLDLLRYNENSNNMYSDCYYIGTLMTAISNTIARSVSTGPKYNFDFNYNASATNGTNGKAAEAEFIEKAIAEIERCQRIDKWMPSYHSHVSRVAIQIKERLSQVGVVDTSIVSLLPFTNAGLDDELRLAAFSAVLSNPAVYTDSANKAVLKYVFKTILNDQCLQLKVEMIKLLGETLGKISMHKYGGGNKLGGGVGSFMIVEETGGEVTESRQDEYKRTTIEGCLAIVKEQFSDNDVLKRGIWQLLSSSRLDILEKKLALDICEILYYVRPSKVVKLRVPSSKQVVAKNLGNGHILFYRIDRPLPTVIPYVISEDDDEDEPDLDVEPNFYIDLTNSAPNVDLETIKIQPRAPAKIKLSLKLS